MAADKFSKWVKKEGGAEAVAAKLGVSGHAVRVWLRGEFAPTSTNAAKIIALSKGELSLTDIIKVTTRNSSAHG